MAIGCALLAQPPGFTPRVLPELDQAQPDAAHEPPQWVDQDFEEPMFD